MKKSNFKRVLSLLLTLALIPALSKAGRPLGAFRRTYARRR